MASFGSASKMMELQDHGPLGPPSMAITTPNSGHCWKVGRFPLLNHVALVIIIV